MERFLPEICTIQYGFPFDSAKFSTTGGMPLIRIRDVVRGYSETYTTEEYKEEYIVNKDDLLIGMDGEFNIAKWGETPALLNQRVCRLLPTPDVDKNYLFYFMPSALKRIEAKTPFVTVKHLSAKELNKVRVPLPPLEEQRRIAALLDKVTDLIAKRQAQLDKLDLLVKARFVEMFGDLKKNSMGWPIKSFPEFAQIDGSMITDFKDYEDFPHIGIDSIEKGTGELVGYRTVKEDGVISGKYLFTPKHIIYSKIRPNLNKVALPDFDGVCSADAYPILPCRDNCNRYYLATVLRSQFFLSYILQFCNRTNLPKVNRKEISGFKMPLPPINLQNQFSEVYLYIKRIKLTTQKSIDNLGTLKQSLMQQYFR